jgi:hypothetical protein
MIEAVRHKKNEAFEDFFEHGFAILVCIFHLVSRNMTLTVVFWDQQE